MKQAWIDEISRGMAEWLQETRVPGAAVALVAHGQPAWVGCFGVLDLGTQTPVTAHAVFEAASLSKPLFAYAALGLAERDRLDLDGPLAQYVAEPLIVGEERVALITARRLLSHSSGLPNWRRDKPLALLFDPGARFGYSGEGYVALQRAMESITDGSLEVYVQEHLLRPLGMAQSSYVWQTTYGIAVAQGHDEGGRPLEKSKPGEANAATSLHTTATDYARFLALMLASGQDECEGGASDEIGLSDAMVAQMLTPQIAIDADTAWGLGWGLKRIEGDWLFWQWGDNRGFKHLVAGSIRRGLALCVFTNGENGYRVWSNVLCHTLDPNGAILHWLERL